MSGSHRHDGRSYTPVPREVPGTLRSVQEKSPNQKVCGDGAFRRRLACFRGGQRRGLPKVLAGSMEGRTKTDPESKRSRPTTLQTAWDKTPRPESHRRPLRNKATGVVRFKRQRSVPSTFISILRWERLRGQPSFNTIGVNAVEAFYIDLLDATRRVNARRRMKLQNLRRQAR